MECSLSEQDDEEYAEEEYAQDADAFSDQLSLLEQEDRDNVLHLSPEPENDDLGVESEDSVSHLGGQNSYLSTDLDGQSVLIFGDVGQSGTVHLDMLVPPGEQEDEDGKGMMTALVDDGKRILVDENGEAVLVQVNKNGEVEMELEMDAGEPGEGGEEGEDVSGEQEQTGEDVPSVPVNQNWFTSREDKSSLQSLGQCWRQGMWSREETELLQANIAQYCRANDITDARAVIFEMSKDERKDFYRVVANGINRPLFSVYRRVIRLYDNKNHLGRYNPEELKQLRLLRSKHGNDWQKIATALGRSAASIRDRCRLLKDNCNTGKWLPEEEDRLAQSVYDLTEALPGEPVTSGISWAAVADRVATRTEKQCRTKWLNYLGWKHAGGTEWTREDDVRLITKIICLEVADESDIDWAELASGWSAARSPQWLRGKWWSLKRHLKDQSQLTFKETCTQLYLMQPEAQSNEEATADATVNNVTVTSLPQPVQSLPTAPMVLDAGMQQTLNLQTTLAPNTLAVNSLGMVTTPVLLDTPVISTLSTALPTMIDEDGGIMAVATSMGHPGLEILPSNLLPTMTAPTILIGCPQVLPPPPGVTFIHTLPVDNLATDNIALQLNAANQMVLNSTQNAGLLLDSTVADTNMLSVQNVMLDSETESKDGDVGLMTLGVDVGADPSLDGDDSNSRPVNVMLNDPMLAHSNSLLDLEEQEKDDGDTS